MTRETPKSAARSRRFLRKHFTQEGIALISVALALVLLGALVAEFSFNSTVDSISGANARDYTQTEFHNRSGANLARLFIRVQTDVFNKKQVKDQLGDFQITDYTGYFMSLFGGGKGERDAMAQALGGFNADAIKGLGITNGSFDVQISSEDGKINVNCANGNGASRDTFRQMLLMRFYPVAFNRLFEEEDSSGWRRTREEQASAIMDYIDRDRTKADAPGTPEDYGYQTLDDRYKAKNNYIDTVSELSLVRGIDDRFWALFGHNFTVYGDCKVNIGSVRDPMLYMAIIALSAKDQENPLLADTTKLYALAQRVVEAKSFGTTFDNLQAFADFVKDPNASLDALFAGSDGVTGPSADDLAGVQPVEGVELDTAKLGQVAKAGDRRIYRVEVTSQVGSSAVRVLERKLIAIWDINTVNQNGRTPGEKGSWVYWREE